MKKAPEIKDSLTQEKIEEIQLYQARLISLFKQTETWDLVRNIILALKKLTGEERRSKMKIQSTRENCLYFTGIEDGIDKVLEEIDKVEAMAEMIRRKREMIALNQQEDD